MLCAKSVSTPSDPSAKFYKDASTSYHDIPAYRRLFGRLFYLKAIKHEILFCTQQ